MLVTVAIPVYNGERYIRQSVESVLAQSYADFELIVTDDGSTDGTLEIVRSINDSRLTVMCDGMHKGLATRLNEQIASAHGAYFVRMDADDVMLPHRLERQVAFVQAHPETDVLGSSAVIIDENGTKIGWRGCGSWKRGANHTLGGQSYCRVRSFMHPTVMGRTEWFRTYYYNPACEGCEDQDLWLRSQKASTFYSLYEPLLYYRDSQQFNLQTYLFRQKTGRYVLNLNASSISWWRRYRGILSCFSKSLIARFLVRVGHTEWLLRVRNKKYSPINNHVLHVITSLYTGGAEKLMVDLLPRLRNRDLEVELAVFDGARTPFFEQLEALEVKIHAFPVDSNVYNPLHIFRLYRLMRHSDIVHTHNTSPQLFAAIANLFVGARLVTTEHNTTNRRRDKAFLKPFDRWMYRQYNRIICISEQAETNLTNYLPEVKPKVCTIFNGIDVQHFICDKPETYFADDSTVRVTMVAAFREQKDHKTLIRAMALLPDSYRLQLAGGGSTELVSDCQKLAAELKISERVSFLGVCNDVPRLLASSAVVVLSSHYEGLSLSSLEGMASGRPFIASDVDGLHEIVEGYGLLVPPEDPKALADTIRWVVDNPACANDIALKCVERAKQFDIEIMADRYNRIYLQYL